MPTATRERPEARTEPAKQSKLLLTRVFTAAIFVYLFVALFPGTLNVFSDPIDGHLLWGLNMLPHTNFLFGGDVVSTYGPLAYLMAPLHISHNLQQGAIVQVITHVALILISLALAWRAGSAWRVALFAATVVLPGIVLTFAECRYELLVSLLACCPLIFPRRGGLIAGVLGAMAAVFCFVKFNLGMSALLQSLVAAGCWHWKFGSKARLWIGCLGGSYAVAAALSSFLLLRSVENIHRWISGSLSIASAYSEAVSIAGPQWEAISGLAILAALAACLLCVLRSQSDLKFPALVIASFMVISFKHAFVRQDMGHYQFFTFGVQAGLSYLLLFAKRTKETVVIVGLIVGCAAIFSTWTLERPIGSGQLERLAFCGNGGANLGRLSHLKTILPEIDRCSNMCLDHYRLSPELVSRIHRQNATVDVLPYNLMYCAANGFRWSPNPVLQLYSAYSPELDAWSAAHFQGGGNPGYIIVHSSTDIDARNTLIANPATWRAIIGNYQPAATDKRGILVLSRRTSPIAEPLIPVAKPTHASIETWMNVPQNSGLLYAKITLEHSLWGILNSVLYQIPPIYIDLAYESGRTASYRLIPKLAETGILANFVPTSLQEIAELLKGHCTDRVLRIRVRAPKPYAFKRNFAINWLGSTRPMRWSSQPHVSHSNQRSPDSPYCYVDCVDASLVTGLTRFETELASTDVVTLSGWAADKKHQCAAGGVVLSVDNKIDIPATYGISRPDVGESLQQPAYNKTGFRAVLPAAAIPAGKHTVRLKVLNKDARCYYDADFTLIVNRK